MIGHLTTHELAVHRPSTTTDDVGGQVVTYSEIGTIRAQVSQPSVEERRVAQQNGTNLAHVLHAVSGADVQRGDELDGDLPSSLPAGRRLRVVATLANSRGTYTRIECEITQAEPESESS